MSNQIALSAIARMNMEPLLIAPMSLSDISSSLRTLSSAVPDDERVAYEMQRAEMMASYGMPDTPSKPFAFSGGVAVIPIHGTLLNRFGASWGYVTGYNFIRAQLDAANADPDVKGIVFDVNSYGGEAAGCFELAADIRASSKPTMAMVDSNAYSAGYMLACSADKVTLTPSGGVGSVGVVATHMSFEKMLDKFGVEVTMIYAGAHKVDGNPYEALPDDVKADIQAGVNKSYEAFTSLVAIHRGLDARAVKDTEARIYRADDAMQLGLIDAVATPSKAVSAFFQELSGSTFMETTTMADQAEVKPGAETPAVDHAAEARKAERERMSGIINCEEAKGKSTLANHLALNTELSVDAAKEILKAAAPEQSAAAKAEPSGQNAFANAMDADNHPEVGADAQGQNGKGEMSMAQKILAAQAAATGVKH